MYRSGTNAKNSIKWALASTSSPDLILLNNSPNGLRELPRPIKTSLQTMSRLKNPATVPSTK
tara:strand:- start:157 stop:342 length:186 start_codon:yes stop_codon:yes gene_type:complete